MTLERASKLFAAGAAGGLANALIIWLAGEIGLPAPKFAIPFLYKQVAWGGLWGLVFLIPLFPGIWWKKGLVMGLLPSLAVFLIFLPMAGAGMFGLNIGVLVPVLVLFFNVVVWGLATAYWAKLTGAIDN